MLYLLIAACVVFAYIKGWLTVSFTGVKDPLLSVGLLGFLFKLAYPGKKNEG